MNVNDMIVMIKGQDVPCALYESGDSMWDDPYISMQMLRAHLNEGNHLASYKPERRKMAAENIIGKCGLSKGSRILDMGCGPGLYSALFAARDIEYLGLDISSQSLGYALAHRGGYEPMISYRQLNYVNLDYSELFDACIMIWCDFGVLSPGDRTSVLSGVYAALKPGGHMAFDVYSPEGPDKLQPGSSWEASESGFWSPKPHLTLERVQYFEQETIRLEQIIVGSEDGIKIYRIWDKHYNRDELTEILSGIGFTDIRIIDGGLSGEQPGVWGVTCSKLGRKSMIRRYHLYQVDSFTKELFTGNPAGVITNADGLTDYEMQKIARELNNSETAFIFSSDSNEYDVHIRFFTPTNEVPICGHATIAAHYTRAVKNRLNTSRVYHKTGAGILPVDIIRENEDYKIIMTQGKIEFGNILDGINKKELLSALNIMDSDLLTNYEIQIVSTGHSKVMVGIKSIEILNTLQPNYGLLSKLSKVIGCNGYYVFTVDSLDNDILIHGRMFAPAIGINEDPVTGNANGPLGAYLVQHNLVQHNNSLFKFKAKQGEAINRSGIIEVEVKINDNKPVEVRISGSAVIVFQSEIAM